MKFSGTLLHSFKEIKENMSPFLKCIKCAGRVRKQSGSNNKTIIEVKVTLK